MGYEINSETKCQHLQPHETIFDHLTTYSANYMRRSLLYMVRGRERENGGGEAIQQKGSVTVVSSG